MKRKDFIDKYDLANAKVLTEDQKSNLFKDLATNFVDRIDKLPNECNTIRLNQCSKEFIDFVEGIENKTVVDLTNIKQQLADNCISKVITFINS